MNCMCEPNIRIKVDPTNPGQFFACCGLFELADRLLDGAEGWFEGSKFLIRPLGFVDTKAVNLGGLLQKIAGATLHQIDPDDDYSSPIDIPSPFNLRLDWWKDDHTGGDRLKAWAGSMRSVRIAYAMQSVLNKPELQNETLLDYGMIVHDPEESDKKVEPFYFDARRGSSARSIDIGFSPDSLQIKTVAYPSVEFLCLVGLQRFRPMPTATTRLFDYYTWGIPIDAHLAPTAVCGLLAHVDSRGYRFENAFRTDQKKHKAFTPATPLKGDENE